MESTESLKVKDFLKEYDILTLEKLPLPAINCNKFPLVFNSC